MPDLPPDLPSESSTASAEYSEEDSGHLAGEWLDGDESLPPRLRRRLLNPVSLALLVVLLIALGFFAGVRVEKSSVSSGSTTSAGAAPGRTAGAFAAAAGGSGARSAFPTGGLGSRALGGGAPTAGSVAYLSGSTLYITTAEGGTVKVNTSPATNVTKSVKTGIGAVHPGETVTVAGSKDSSGAVTARTVLVGLGGGTTGFPAAAPGAGAAPGGEGGARALFGAG